MPDPEHRGEPGEQILAGGVNRIRRIGDLVERPAGPHTPSVHRLLSHIRSRGFRAGPEPLAIDHDRGVERVTFVAGAAVGYPLPADLGGDPTMESAALLLRDYHDATVDFEPRDGDHWTLPPRPPAEVICHGDFAPYNCSFRHGLAVGLFDFDTAHPGPRVWDVAYAAYRWVPLTAVGPEDLGAAVAEQRRRLELFCHRYGFPDRGEVIRTAALRLEALIDHMRSQAGSGHPAFSRHLAEGHDRIYEVDIAHLRARIDQLSG